MCVKKGLLKGKIIFLIMLLLIVFSFNLCEAKSSLIKTDIKIEVQEDFTFDVSIIQNIDTDMWSTEGWIIGLGAEMQNVIISDSSGSITPKETKLIGEDYKQYIIDTHYKSSLGYKPIYINSTGNPLEKLNDNLHKVNLLLGIHRGEISNENVTFTLNFPKSMVFLKSTEEGEHATISYYNPGGYFHFMFLSGLDNFAKISDESKTFFVENRPLLVNGTKKAVEKRDCILNYPLNKKDSLIISLGNTKELSKDNDSEASGLYMGEGWVVLDQSYYNRESSEEELGGTIVHELTHYSNDFGYIQDNYPKWLEEGSAVYSNIKYAERTFDVNNLTSYDQLYLYDIKPYPEILKYWYDLDKDFYETNYSYNFTGGGLYSLYGFVVNHYAKTYGEEALILSLNEIRNKPALSGNKSSLSEEESDYAAIKSLITNSKSNISEEDIFFPDRALFMNNYSQFEEKMAQFMIPPNSAVHSNFSFNSEDFFSLLIGGGIVLFIILLPILLIIFLVKRLTRKKEDNKNKKI